MNIEEKLQIMKKNKDNNYCFVSPFFIQREATIGDTKDTIDLYVNMEKNTKEFADDIIFSLMETAAEYGIYGEKKINLKLAFSGDMKEYPDKISEFPDFVFRNKDKFVAIYEYVKGEITENYFLSFSRTESYYDYGHLYFKLDTLLKLFDEYGVYYNIITTMDKSIPSLHRKDDYTQFIIGTDPSIKSYNEEKEEERKTNSTKLNSIKRILKSYKKR